MAQRYLHARLRHIRLRRAGRTVLRDIDWTISPGQRWILAGANGAGKTQLLKLVAGSVWPTPTGRELRHYRLSGTVYRTPLEVQEEIAYVGPERQDKYERYGWNFTAEQIVGTGLRRTDIPLDALTAPDRRAIAAVLGELSLSHLAERRFLTLSYGERRLVLLARALASQPKLLLLDELLAGLDAVNHAAALDWLDRTGRSRLPWALATHRIEDVPRSATHALVLDDGRIVYRGRFSRAPLGRWLGPHAPEFDGAEEGEGEGAMARRPRVNPAPGGRPRGRRAIAPSPPRRSKSVAQFLVRLWHASVYLDERCVLHDLSLEILHAQCWVVHGPNGSGKSTLLRTIYGDHSVAAGGRIERAGIEPGVPLELFKRRVGLIAPHLQSSMAATRSVLGAEQPRSGLDAEPRDLTVNEAVQSGRHASIGLDAPPSLADRRAAQRTLAAFGLGTFGARTLRELSYGQLRRVLFARAWINRPQLLLLDEPFAGLDAATRRLLLRELATLTAAGTTIVMATHRREEWPRGATHELELRAGRSRYCGPVRAARGAAHSARERAAGHG
jgi:molybdate transport system ATP-binding protein